MEALVGLQSGPAAGWDPSVWRMETGRRNYKQGNQLGGSGSNPDKTSSVAWTKLGVSKMVKRE